MSFWKSYYASVSSYFTRPENPDDTGEKRDEVSEYNMKQSKSEGWLSSVYSDAYNQTEEVWKAVKTDLSEFANVVSRDTKSAVIKTATGVRNGLIGSDEITASNDSTIKSSKIKTTITRLFEQMSKALYIPPESDDDDYFDSDSRSGGTQKKSGRVESRIDMLQRDRKTFETNPTEEEIDSDLGDFETWQNDLSLDDFQSTIAELIKSNEFLFDFYTEFVPQQMTHDTFWSRYFYRVASIKLEESRREALKLRIITEKEAESAAQMDDWDEGCDGCELAPTDKIVEPLNDVSQMSGDPTSLISEDGLKIKENEDVLIVKHSAESSSASEDNNICEMSCAQKEGDDLCSWDDDIEIEVTEDDIQMSKTLSENATLETKWDDWS